MDTFIQQQGGSMDELYELAKNETEVAYSDAWVRGHSFPFVFLFEVTRGGVSD